MDLNLSNIKIIDSMLSNFLKPFKFMIFDHLVSKDVVIFSILLLIIPIALITGPAIPDILLSLIALYFLVKSVYKKLWNYYNNPIVIGFLFFSLYGILRSLYSEMPLESLSNEGSMFYFRYIFFAMGTWYLLDNNPYLSRCLLIISVTCILVICSDALFQYFNGVNIFGNKKYNPTRLTGMFGKEPIVGRYISFLSIFSFVLIYENFSKTKKMIILTVAFLILSEVTIFLTGERAPFFYISLFSILVLMYMPHYRRYRIIGILVSTILIFLAMIFNPNAKTRFIDHTLNQMDGNQIILLPYSQSHEEIYLTAIKIFKDQPLFGAGTNTFRYQCIKEKYKYKNGCTTHPHNIYLQILTELGLIGLAFLIAFYLKISLLGIRQLYYVIKSNKYKQISFESFLFPMVLFVYLWPLMPTMSFYNNWMNVLIMMPLGFYLKYFYKK